MQDCEDYILMEWICVPMMPAQEHFDRAWDNIVSRATEKFGAEAVAVACQQNDRLRTLCEARQPK